MFGSGIFLARHIPPYETWNQVGQLCLGLQAQLMLAIFPHLFLKNAICGLKDTLNFIILLVRTADLVYGHEGSQHPVRGVEK